MIKITTYRPQNKPDESMENSVIDFLFTHLDQYGDAREDIGKAFRYALSDHTPGGIILTASDENNGSIVGAVVVNRTGMDGYIPENILVYIATDQNRRGQGIGKKLMQAAIDESEGDIALHCEPENPARHLYEKLGFTSKYLELRLKK